MRPSLSILLLCCACLMAGEENLLRNGVLEMGAGGLNGWSGMAGQAVAEPADAAAGVPAGIRVTIAGVDRNSHGQITQRSAVTKADAHYRIACHLKASAERAGYLQAKLYGADGKELKRITLGHATTTWRRIDGVVDASGASAIEVLLRWIPDPKLDKATVCFAGPTLALTDAAPTAAPAR